MELDVIETFDWQETISNRHEFQFATTRPLSPHYKLDKVYLTRQKTVYFKLPIDSRNTVQKQFSLSSYTLYILHRDNPISFSNLFLSLLSSYTSNSKVV